MKCVSSMPHSPDRFSVSPGASPGFNRRSGLLLPQYLDAVVRSMNYLSSDPSNPTLASRSLPRIGITMGDPAGIGPEVVLKAVAEEEVLRCCAPVIIGDAQLLAHNARTLDLQCGYQIVRRGEPFPDRNT